MAGATRTWQKLDEARFFLRLCEDNRQLREFNYYPQCLRECCPRGDLDHAGGVRTGGRLQGLVQGPHASEG
jgi:hypothetical protein